jgi:hypothetical protein
VRLYTVHGEPPRENKGPEGWPEPKARPPVLVQEGFAFWAFLFGPFWFAWHRLWREALALLVLELAIGWLLPDPASMVLGLALQVLVGLEARDRLRARLARQGLPQLAVVAAPDLDLAWFRLTQQRPDLVRAAP